MNFWSILFYLLVFSRHAGILSSVSSIILHQVYNYSSQVYHFFADSPAEHLPLLFLALLGWVARWIWNSLEDCNETELFPGLVTEQRSPSPRTCGATKEPSLWNYIDRSCGAVKPPPPKSSSINTAKQRHDARKAMSEPQEPVIQTIQSWIYPRTVLGAIGTVTETVKETVSFAHAAASVAFDAATGRIPEVHVHEQARPRTPNVEMPRAYSWRFYRSHRKRGPRQYHLRMRIERRGQSRPTMKRHRQKRREAKRKAKEERAKRDDNKVPEHWKNVSEEEKREDYEREKHKYLHRSFLQFDLQYGVSLDEFVTAVKPELFFQNVSALSADSFLQTSKQRKSRRARARQALIAAQRLRPTSDPSYLTADTSHDMRVYISSDDSMPIVIDTGASLSLTPNLEDFVEPPKPCALTHLHGLSGNTEVLGVGTVEWTVRDIFGEVRTLRCQAYWVPGASIRLFSPQRFFQEHRGGQCIVTADRLSVVLPNGQGTLDFPYQASSNLPMMLPATEGAKFSSFIIHPTDQLFREKSSIINQVFLNTADDNNANLSPAQRQLLLWHQKCGHCDMQRLQTLAVWRKKEDGTYEPSHLPVQFKSGVSSCPRPMCAACQMAKQSRRTPATDNPRRGGTRPPDAVLRADNLDPGGKVSVDQYMSAVPGRREHTKSKEKMGSRYQGGTIFVDHATQLIYVHHQESLGSRATIQGKRKYEKWCRSMGHRVKTYHADNHPFRSNAFKQEVENCDQEMTHSGVGAHHQNGVAERSIQTVTQWARAMLLHQMLHWPDEADHTLWPFALSHAVYLWNHMPKKDSLLAPIELYTGTAMDHQEHFKRLHVWGAPVYVLDPKLQDGKKLPKWNPRSRQGMYLGFSPEHSTLVSNVLNLRSGHVGPQYHVVIDDLFTTVPNADQGGLYDPITFDAARWESLLETGYERHLDDETDEAQREARRDRRNGLNGPVLGDEWLTGPEQRVRRARRAAREARLRMRQLETRRQRQEQNRHLAQGLNQGGENRQVQTQQQEAQTQTEGQVQDQQPVHENDSDSDSDFDPGDGNFADDDRSVPEGAGEIQDEDPGEAEDEVEQQRQAQAQRPPRTVQFQEPLRRTARTKQPSTKYPKDKWATLADAAKRKITLGDLNQTFLAGLKWVNLVDSLQSDQFSRTWNKTCAPFYDEETQLQDDLDPMILAAKANAEDNPSWHEAMNGPLKEGYMEACDVEIGALEHKEAWEVVDKEDFMNVLPSTWAFKCKRYPDGSVRKLKARFCVRGDRQIEGVDFFETWAPVVNWNTVRLMLILSQVLGLATQQVDYTTAFLHAPIEDEVYVEMPQGYRQNGKVLRLKKSLYGLKQSPKNFFNYLKGNLEAVGFQAMTDVDPCLFISEKCICLVYVDDTLFFSPDPKYIDEAIAKLKGDRGMELEAEDSVAGFLGVHIERDERNNTIKLTQTGLIDRICKALGTNKGCDTPAATNALPIDAEGDPPDQLYNYASVVGMLLYLSGHSRPDIAFAVSQVARFIHNHKRSHEVALERIGQYLYKTSKEGLILRPTKGEFDMTCYVDSDFAGLWNVEDQSSPESVRSRAGYVICVCGCPVIWKSQLMGPIALSTMHAEYNALSMAMKDVLPLQELFKTIGGSVGIGEDHLTSFKTTVYEDNMGALRLAQLEPGQHTPRSKHYGVKTHWFRSHLKPNRTFVVKIDTTEQWADILTKGLPVQTFEAIRFLMCGW